MGLKFEDMQSWLTARYLPCIRWDVGGPPNTLPRCHAPNANTWIRVCNHWSLAKPKRKTQFWHLFFNSTIWFPCCLTAHLAKGNVSFCHHLVFVVCRPFLTFHILIFSSETPQSNQLKLGRKHLWERTTDDEHQVMAKAHIAFGKVS
jgi:hypothetical protein